MPTNLIVGLIVLVAAVIVARSVGERAQGTLTDRQKLQVSEQLAALRKVQLVPLLLLLVAYFLLVKLTVLPSEILYWSALVTLAVYVIALNAFVFHRLKRLQLPAEFFRLLVASRSIQLVGLAVFLVLALMEARGN